MLASQNELNMEITIKKGLVLSPVIHHQAVIVSWIFLVVVLRD